MLWQEIRPSEQGRTVLVSRRGDGPPEEVAADVRTLVHEYGGRAYAAGDGLVVWSDRRDQRLQTRAGPLTPDDGTRYADHEIAPDGRRVVCVRERHGEGEAVNDLVAVPLAGGEPVVLAGGRDFYMAPRLSRDGRRLAWLAWDHPDMPWDGAEVWTAAADGSGARRLAGGGGVSASQPRWSPAGELHWVDDAGGWWNLRSERDPAVAPMEAEFTGPDWVFGQSSYAFLADGTLVAAWMREGFEHLGVVRGGGVEEIPTPFSVFDSVRPARDGVVAVAASPTAPSAVVRITLGGEVEVLREGPGVGVDPAYVSVPRPVSFDTAHALFYPPANPEFRVPEGERPPLIVLSHGGPTAAASPSLDRDIQFWTSRGFAVAGVDYRGSTGYGRAFRDALRGLWGIADVEDCMACARHLAAAGEIDPDRVVIRGWSAGGYTTLAALTTTGAFAAGSCHYGIGDLRALAEHTHKFESRYLDGLVGEQNYDERSPVRHAHRVSSPTILFQGLEDAVVPPAQAEEMVGALDARGVPHAYLAFEGEQHGFRRAETIRRVAEAELAFLGRVLGFEPADELPELRIAHAEALHR